MLTRLYVEALLVDEDLADQVWGLWDAGEITNEVAAWAWCILAGSGNEGCAQDVQSHRLQGLRPPSQ